MSEALPWSEPGLGRIQREIRKCRLAAERGYRAAYYERKWRRLNRLLLQAEARERLHTDRSDQGVGS